ncbi:legume-like lectin [Rhodotorula toruloides]|uniref:Legume-like lectin n=1 Tax=Rhodotorula toruloides TaxID=5286 RepID=A0A511KA26_RHOTO|nr:legume-like lectin [Rhodotorula toruloides]
MLVPAASAALLAATFARAASSERWTPPENLHYEAEHSWRGLTADGKVGSGFDVSGHASVLPGVHDFLRLVPSVPLAHGAVFSRKPLTSKEWIVEMAFRVHGPPTTGLTETGEDGKVKRLHKGGRGLAFWYTKSGLPGPAVMSSDPKMKVSPPPPLVPETPRDPHDHELSLFGSRVSFDGLGIVFDASPNAPVWRRSDQRNYVHAGGDEPSWGVGLTGVVSGIIDDGTQKWLDADGKSPQGEEEAAYLGKAVGECEAAFRNAQGLLWARIAHFNHTLRVDLDLSPHTTLAKAGRHYEHNCFNLEGINLPANSYVGISGLASGNTEPDVVDVYAMDVFEILQDYDPKHHVETAEPPEDATPLPLEGTSDDAVSTLTHELFLSQAKMVEAIDDLARKVESVSNLVSELARHGGAGVGVGVGRGPPSSAGGGSEIPDARLSALESHLRDLVAMGQARDHESFDQRDALTHVKQLSDRIWVEVQAVARKVDEGKAQHSATLSSLSTRLTDLSSTLLSSLSSSTPYAPYIYGGVGAVLGGLLVGAVGRRRRADDPWAQARKLI